MPEALQLFLVEDEEDFAYLMRKSLERAGHQVTVCRTGADALIVLRQSQFSLVVLDERLPDMRGLDLLRTLNNEGNATPVLMVTGFGDEQLATQVLRAGALDYIVKDNALTFLGDLPKRIQESLTRHRLQQTNRLLIEAIESTRDGIMITDLQGRLEHVNGALEHMFGYARAELLGQTPRMLKSSAHSREFFENMWQTILARASWQGELVNKRKDGTLLDTSLTISPILDSRGQLTHFVGIYRDISERRLMERQLFQAQKMQSVGTLAGGVAHEFNNLLAGIQGYAALGLRETEANGTVKQFFEFIVDLSERAANLTRQLLAFARKPALSRQPTAMENLVTATAELVKSSLKIDVTVTLADAADGPLVALADANQLQQVLVNLALNARDAMAQPGFEPVEFRLTRQWIDGEMPAFPENVPSGDYVVLEVEDHGCGMSAEVLGQALDPFFTTKEVGKGTGLGLPVAFGIIHGHQGFMTIDTTVGQGTRARIYLPRLDQEAAADAEAPGRGPTAQARDMPSRHILVVDDEDAVLDVVGRFLGIAGHVVTTATSGQAAMDMLARGPSAELIILDLMIPREEGLANFRRFRDRFPHIPILLCTGLVHAEEASHLLEAGAADLLRKPFRMDDLWNAVNRALTRLAAS